MNNFIKKHKNKKFTFFEIPLLVESRLMKKFDLIGVPYQIIIGKKSDSESLEFKEIDKDIKKLKIEEIIKIIKSKK